MRTTLPYWYSHAMPNLMLALAFVYVVGLVALPSREGVNWAEVAAFMGVVIVAVLAIVDRRSEDRHQETTELLKRVIAECHR